MSFETETRKAYEFKTSEEQRKSFIEGFVVKLVRKFPAAFAGKTEEEKIAKAQEEALEKYMYNENYWNYSYDEITNDLSNEIQSKYKAMKEEKDLSDKANQHFQDVIDGKIASNNITDDINELSSIGTFTVDISSDDTFKSDLSDKVNQYVQDVMSEKTTNNETFRMIEADNETFNRVDSGELSMMLDESNDSKQATVEKTDTNAVQYTKSINTDNNQRGNASLFNIVLVVLGIATFILTAMILNLLLK